MSEFPALLTTLADATIRSVIETLEADPDRDLSEVGFKWAWFLALKSHWPNVHMKDTTEWIEGYMHGVKFGDPGHSWSANTAKDLARDFVAEFGEAA